MKINAALFAALGGNMEIDVNKKELWEQMKKNAVNSSCYSVTFETIDTDENTHQIACYVDEQVPVITSNFQHAGLISGIIGYLTKYIDDISSIEEFEDKYIVIGAFTEELAKLSLSLGKCMDKFMKEMRERREKESENTDE